MTNLSAAAAPTSDYDEINNVCPPLVIGKSAFIF